MPYDPECYRAREERNKEKKRAYKRAWYAKNRKRIQEYWLKWSSTPTAKAAYRERYLRNREHNLAYSKQYHAKHRDYIISWKRTWRLKTGYEKARRLREK